MELRHIRYFVRAAELLHFTHAAESLYISQPTLSTHIQQLEEELGLPLFNRTGRSVRLTDAGKIFFEHAQRILNELDVAKERLDDLQGLRRGHLRVGALPTFGPELLPSWISSFHACYPDIHIKLETGTSDFLEDQLRAGAIDLALSFVPAESDDIQSEILFTEQIYLVVANSHPLAKLKQVDVQTLATLPLALVGQRWSARRVYDAFFAMHGINPAIVIEVDDLNALLGIISEGKVCSLLAGVVAAKQPHLCMIPIDGHPPSISYGVLWPTVAHRSPAAAAFLAHMKDKCQIIVSG